MNLRSLQRKMTILAMILFINGCASKAWIIQRDQNGGVIGYKDFRSSEAADNAIRDLIPCSNFKMISDELHTSQSTSFVPIPTSQTTNGTAYNNYGESVNYQATSNGTQYVPMMTNNSYRTFTYKCEASNAPFTAKLEQTLYQNNDSTLKPKIGTLNIQQVLLQCDAGKKAREVLRAAFDTEQAKLIKEEKEIKKMQTSLSQNGKSYSSIQKEQMQIEIEARINTAKRTKKEKQDFIQELENEVKTPILAQIKLTVDELALKERYTLIQQSEEGSSDDLTEKIIERINNKSIRSN